MSTTQHTGHYNLPTFGDNPNDRPSWRGDFTDAMTKIDNQMYANATNITTATAAANNATTAAGEAKKVAETATSLSQTNKNNIADLNDYFGKLGVTSESTAQQLMNTINGKAENTELTSLKSTVSSLSNTVNTKANTSDVYTKGQVDTTFTKQGGYSGTAQQLNQRIQALEQDTLPICLCIGDSYANSTSTVNADSTDATKWPTQLRNIIGSQYQVKNYSVTGAGFNVSGKTFTDQIDNAYNAPAIDNDNVAIIIIGGGRNDIGTTSQMKGYANSTFSNARTKFPKARIISVPMLWHNAGMDMYGRQKAAGVAEAAAANGVENVDWAWTWNIGNDSNFSSGDIHPNANGAKVIASYMASAIRGTYTGRYEAATVQSSNGHVRSNVVASGGMVFATLWGGDSTEAADLQAGVTFPSWARIATGSSPDNIQIWGAGLTNSGTAVNGWLLTDVGSSTSGAPKIKYRGGSVGANNGCFVCYPW